MAKEEIGNLIPTYIPGYSDDADIQAALRVYHYGDYDYSPSNTSPASLVSPSMAKTIYDIQQDILSLDASTVQNSIFTAKGQILTATASNTPTVLPLGTNYQFLIAKSDETTGLLWTNTLTAPSISTPTISGGITLSGATTGSTVLQASSTAAGTITLPAVTGTVVTTGDTGTVTSTMISSLAWSKLTSTPTTLSGYGITDALSNSTISTQSGYFGDIFLYDDSTPSHYLQITNSANLTATRTLSLNVNDAARTISLSGNLTVSSAATVSGTNTGDQTITLTGDVTGSGTGSFATTLATVATAGTYKSVTINAKGLVTSGTNPTTLSGYGITDALSNSSTSTQNGYFGDIFLYDDSTPSHYLQITNSANLTAARTLSINVNDAARTVSLSGNLTVSATSTVSGTNTGDQTITLTGDVTGSGTGSFATTLANSGVTSGTYRSVTVDSKGRVTAGTNPTTLSGYGITDAAALAGATFTGQIQSTLANNTATGGGQIYLNGATGNRIDFAPNGTAAPTVTTRSVGTKIVLYPLLSGSSVDFALGIEATALWQSVSDSSLNFKWYAGTTNIATLSGAGTLTLTGPIILPAATTTSTSIRAPHGTAPTSPTNGDIWTTTSGLYAQINGSTVGPFGTTVSGDSDQIVLGMQIFF